MKSQLRQQCCIWPVLLYAYPWFPKGLKGVGLDKRTARLNYLLKYEPEEAGLVCEKDGRHNFWKEGFAKNKEKRDKVVEHGGLKVIDYPSLESIILKVVRESKKLNSFH